MATNEDAARPQPERLKTDREDTQASEQASSPLRGLKAIGTALRRLFGNWRALLALLLLYAVMLASLYFFIAVREASVWQVLVTFLLAALIPVIFFVIQTIGVRYAESDVRTKDLLRWSMRDFWKLLVATVPLLLLAWLLSYLFGKFQVNVPTVATGAGANAAAAAARPAAVPTAAELFSWKEVVLTTLRFLIFGLVLPLLAIHLWISAARRGLKGAFRNAGRVLSGALAPGAVLVYTIGLLLFGVIPYFLITTTYTRGGAWTQLTLLGARLLAASLFMLFGWLITLGALSIISPEEKLTERATVEDETAAETEAAEAKASEPVAE